MLFVTVETSTLMEVVAESSIWKMMKSLTSMVLLEESNPRTSRTMTGTSGLKTGQGMLKRKRTTSLTISRQNLKTKNLRRNLLITPSTSNFDVLKQDEIYKIRDYVYSLYFI